MNPFKIPIREFIQTSGPLRSELKKIYDQLPPTRCQRLGQCCSLLPEMTFLEALPALKSMESWPPADRIKVMRKMVRYFLCNALEINSCPFLSGKDCLIYEDRFFGCRAYGLWSRDYYQDLAEKNRQGKGFLQQRWESLGISLPGEVLSFEVPYCSRIEVDPRARITDEILSGAWEKIEKLSQELPTWDREFRENYLSDLSFFLTGHQFGVQEAIRLKYFITREMISKRDSSRLDQALSLAADPFLEESFDRLVE